MSLAAAHRIGAAIGILFGAVPGSTRDAGLVNMRIAYPELSDRELRKFARECSANAGRILFELPAVWAWPGERLLEQVREIEGMQLLDQAVARGKGVILAVPHIGAWEVALLWAADKTSMTAPYREPRLPEMEEYIRAARQRTGARMLPSQQSAARNLLKALRAGGVIGIAPDQDAGSGGGVFVPLFHEIANTGTLLPRLAAKSGATVLWMYTIRLDGGKGYTVHIEEAHPDIASEDVGRAAAAMNCGIESIIRRHPSQYLWFYKRYRRRPEGSPRKIYTKGAWRKAHFAGIREA